jgi:metallo-beta-lactamase class B
LDTKGCTTWTLTAAGKRVVFVCSTTAPGYALKNNAAYPEIAADFRKTFRILDALACDVFLASHGSFFHLEEKMKRRDPQAFVDPAGYRAFLARTRKEFEDQLRAQ